MLSFAQKLAIADSFPELERKDVSLGRVNYHYEQSAYDKKAVVYHLHQNGNGFVYVGDHTEYDADAKGLVNIREFDAEQLRSIIGQSIQVLSVPAAHASAGSQPKQEQRQEQTWTNARMQSLTLKFEDEDRMWYIYSGMNLDSVFETYAEAIEYLQEEGFNSNRSGSI